MALPSGFIGLLHWHLTCAAVLALTTGCTPVTKTDDPIKYERESSPYRLGPKRKGEPDLATTLTADQVQKRKQEQEERKRRWLELRADLAAKHKIDNEEEHAEVYRRLDEEAEKVRKNKEDRENREQQREAERQKRARPLMQGTPAPPQSDDPMDRALRQMQQNTDKNLQEHYRQQKLHDQNQMKTPQ
jgi:hypothetical protein